MARPADCHPDRVHWGLGLCNPCWQRERGATVGRQQREQRRARMDALKDAPCMDCGGRFPPEAMQFDHVRGKKKMGVSRMYEFSLAALLDEIAKCDLVCANCHAVRTRRRSIG